MNLELEGKRVLITGGSSGLGFAVAQALVDEGARVALNARDTPRLDEACARLGAVAVPADLSTPDGPRRAVEQATRALGGLDGVLVNSGGPAAGNFSSLDEATWQSAIEGTLLSSIRLLQHAVIELKSGVAPAIAVILSSSVHRPIPGLTTSNVLRPGLAGLVRSLAVELAPQIRINAVAPGRLNTARLEDLDAKSAARAGRSPDEVRAAAEAAIPLARYGEPRELGDLVAFLLSARASYITGQIIGVDGGSGLA
ncbi:MAG TPA: SDR family oxidoreductase [Terrimesophilobacter sp.]|nr:SDR family oxidoreductase [Terrimesophilobacter sp.]